MKNVYIDIILTTVNLDLINKTIWGRWETENVHI